MISAVSSPIYQFKNIMSGCAFPANRESILALPVVCNCERNDGLGFKMYLGDSGFFLGCLQLLAAHELRATATTRIDYI